jgi:hypothetical protein
VGYDDDVQAGHGVSPGQRFRARYGAGPLHLIALAASFAIAGWAVLGWFQRSRDVVGVLIWFTAAIVLHDLVAMPVYSLLDRVALGSLRERRDRREAGWAVSPIPYLRIPALLGALLFAVFSPWILGFGAGTERYASGIAEGGYLTRWLLATGAIFALSGAAYALAAARAGRSEQRSEQ